MTSVIKRRALQILAVVGKVYDRILMSAEASITIQKKTLALGTNVK